MTKFTLPQQIKIVEAMAPATDAAGRTSDWVCLKNYGKCYIVFHVTQGNAATILITLLQGSAVAGTGSKVLTNAQPIWFNIDTSLTDTLVRQTDAVNFTTDAGVKNKQVVMEIDPTTLDVANGFDCVAFSTGASNAGNITSAQFFLTDPRYAQSTLPSAIID